jgi:hypothetical protein
MTGGRDAGTAFTFMQDLAGRLSNRVQLTTDGHRAYLNAVEDAFGSEIDYAMLVKMYGADGVTESRYSPAVCIGCRRVGITGRPDPKHISISVERQNLTMRMSMRRFTRLTNGFSKKVENLGHSVALHYIWYNFARVHKTLRVTPAMEAGISDHVWSFEEIARLSNGSTTEGRSLLSNRFALAYDTRAWPYIEAWPSCEPGRRLPWTFAPAEGSSRRAATPQRRSSCR